MTLLDAKRELYARLATRSERIEQVDVVLCEDGATIACYVWLDAQSDDDFVLVQFDVPKDSPVDKAAIERELMRFLVWQRPH